MSGLFDLLAAALAPSQVQTPTADSAPSTPVSGISVSAPPRPTSNAQSYNNTPEVTQIHQIENQYPQQPVEQMPRSWHGTLGRVLGGLGDAFLVGSGRQPEFLPRLQQQEVGNAMVGASSDPFGAADRVAATGAPQSAELARQLIEEGNQAKLRQQMQEQNNWYRQAMTNDRNQNVFARQAPIAIGAIRGITDPAKYAAMYGLWDQRAKSVDANADATSAYGLPSPDDWKPGYFDQNYGMTANQQQQSADKAAQRQTSMRNTDVNAGARMGAAGINAGARRATYNPNTASIMSNLIAKQNAGQQLTPSEQAFWAHNTQLTHSGSIPGGLRVQPQGGAQQHQYINGQVYQDAHGNKARYQNGQWIPIQ